MKRSRPAVPLLHDPDRRRATDFDEPESIRLLIVDDDRDYCAWLLSLTRRNGFDVEIAYDGEAALERLAEEQFDLAVIDQEMPRLTGLQVIERIRAQDNTKTIYALMLTSRGEIETKLNALAAGFDDFLGKSSPQEEIVAKLIAARRIAVRQRTLDATVRELYGLATRDELTGVFNRRFFVVEAERLLAARCIVNIVLFDLDNFKSVNDTYGHLAGDRVLRDIGTLFHRNTRPEDLIARYGGDEFVMVVPHLPVEDIERITERLANDVRALQWSIGQEPFSLGITTGIGSSALLVQPTLAQLLDAADRDLYKNKWLQRDRLDLLPPIRRKPLDV
ncbi:MAG TPA: diguanylate cyclase [Thermoanaerobaculia bacterium]|nr:diguanylate cyclase [Thermoanaerobaculia bacterium]